MTAPGKLLWVLQATLCAVGPVAAQVGPQEPLDPEPRVVYRSPLPRKVCPRSPGLLRLDDGRLVISMEYSLGGARFVPGIERTPSGTPKRGVILVSDDRGRTVRQTSSHPLIQGRAFVAGERLYYLGHQGDLGILSSTDRGETWSEVAWLTKGQQWHQAPCTVRYARGRVYLVMERMTLPLPQLWPVQSFAPVVLSAPVDADLTQREAWTFSNEVTYTAMLAKVGSAASLGVPFYTPGPTTKAKSLGASRPMALPGWLETHLVTFPDPNHLWHDPEDRTVYLFARANTGRTNLACVAKAVEGADGSLTVQPALAPSGKPLLYVPLPGGHLKFHIVYDAQTRRYWLASNQSTDSMTRPDALPAERYMLGDNERHRLVLHVSRNGVDWVFAGLIDKTDDPRQARSYPAMVIDGDDLLVLARSGDEHARDAHEANLLTLHRIPNFRSLAD